MKTEYKRYSREEKIKYFISKIEYFEMKILKAQARLDELELEQDNAIKRIIKKKSARSK